MRSCCFFFVLAPLVVLFPHRSRNTASSSLLHSASGTASHNRVLSSPCRLASVSFLEPFLFFVRKLIIQGFKAYQKNKNISYLSRVIVKTNKQHANLKFIYLLSFLPVNFDLFLNINILIKR